MKYPKIRQQANMTVTVPGLSGGINKHDSVSSIEDNQLTAVDNMWWRGSMLKTRPGLQYADGLYDVAYTHQQWVSDRETLLTSCVYKSSTRAVFSAARMTQADGFQKIGQNGQTYYTKPVNGKAPTGFGCRAVQSGQTDAADQSEYLFFLSNGDIIRENKKEASPSAGAGWVAAEPYVPTLNIDDRAYQAANMLTGQFKSRYIPDGHTQHFQLPLKELTYNDSEITTVTFKIPDQTNDEVNEYTATFKPSEVMTDKNTGEKYAIVSVNIKLENIPGYHSEMGAHTPTVRVLFSYTYGAVNMFIRYWGKDNDYQEAVFPASSKDTIEVTAWKTIPGRREKICSMTDCTWFGNSQLFVCGHPTEKNLVYWSDTSRPLYFPENNYVYVGDYGQAVTAMRQQGELLVLFQEHRMHGMTYQIADDEMYEYALSLGLDAISIAVQFALVSIHPAIGCDCPGSIRLVNNRLVWATSDGKVYMLPSVNQYNERNVREISRNIFALLSQHGANALRKSFSGEFGGYYVLLVDNCMYLVDAQTSAFASFNYYSNEEKAQKSLPWFRWTLPEAEYLQLMANDTVMYLVVSKDNECRVALLDGETDDGEPIVCSFTSKMFDFGRPDNLKAVMQMYIGIGDSPESTVNLSYITEEAVYDDVWSMESFGDYSKHEAGFMRVHRLTPNVNRARVFGFRCDSVGAVSVGEILIKFKEQGVVR